MELRSAQACDWRRHVGTRTSFSFVLAQFLIPYLNLGVLPAGMHDIFASAISTNRHSPSTSITKLM